MKLNEISTASAGKCGMSHHPGMFQTCGCSFWEILEQECYRKILFLYFESFTFTSGLCDGCIMTLESVSRSNL